MAAALRAFSGHDAVGTRLGTSALRVASESQCRAACCRERACVGFSVGAQQPSADGGGGGGDAATSVLPCVLLSEVRQLVPSNVMDSYVRPAAVPQAGAA